MRWDNLDAVLFDLDGVLTPTAEVHMRAWHRLFTEYFDAHSITPPYTEDDYFAHVDGKPRYDGVRSALVSRGIHLPEGSPDDPPGAETICGLGNAKNVVLHELIETEGVAPYPGSLALVDHLEQRGMALAVVSSSRNARGVLRAAGLVDRFGVIVDGHDTDDPEIDGKPAPDMFVKAATDLGTTPARSAVVEDAVSGVRAGRNGAFALVIGVDRGAGEAALREAGADVVVTDLADLIGVDA